ncbi:GHKL domain-containing protein [bacterium]|nr:GHKL domain-containing protein [bacterium]
MNLIEQSKSLTTEQLRTPELGRLFSIYLTSSWRDLADFNLAWLKCRANGAREELAAALANIVDIAAVSVPVTEPDFAEAFAHIARLVQRLDHDHPVDGVADLLAETYEQTLAERRDYLRKYFRLRPVVSSLLEQTASADPHVDQAAQATQVQETCCNGLLDMLGARRALLYYRKSKAYDAANTTFNMHGSLTRAVASFERPPDLSATPDPAAAAEMLQREINYLLTDISHPARGLSAVPDQTALRACDHPLLYVANHKHFAMLREQAGQCYQPMYLPLEFLIANSYYRKFILGEKLPSSDDLQAMPLDGFYTDQRWQFFQGGLFDYLARLLIPLTASGTVFGYISIDAFDRKLGELVLDDSSRETLRDYEIYRRHRKSAQVKYLPSWLRENEPALVREILLAAPDAIKDEDDFLRNRGVDFMDSNHSLRFYTFLREKYSVRFQPTDENLQHLMSRFTSSKPISHQATRFAQLLSNDIAGALVALNSMNITETKAHRAALIHVNKERNLTSRTLRHEGINKLTAMRNAVFDLRDYLLSLDQAWQHYVRNFGAFSQQHIAPELYEQLGQVVKPLYSLLEERDKWLETIDRCNKIGKDLNDLLLRYKGAEFKKGKAVIHKLLDEVLDMYNELYFVGSHIKLTRNYCEPDLVVYCYRDLLITVFCAYLDNAYEALLRGDDRNRSIEITTEIDQDMFHFTLADSGSGFYNHPRISVNPMLLFSGYTSKDGEGHGVGLTIVREIIEDVAFHNGQLDVPSSEPGRTVFGFRIPLEETRSVQLKEERHSADSEPD